MNAVTRRPDARRICGNLGEVREPWRRTSSVPSGKSGERASSTTAWTITA